MARAPRYFGAWGNVPVDDDVRPFSMINPVGSNANRTNRRHHFISAVYMNGFADDRGRVLAYLCEAPEDPLPPMNPRAIGFERDYYSQKLPGGGQENHCFEDLWNTIETGWPETVRALAARRLSAAISFNVLGMQTILRARVPATRDRHALMIEAKIRCEHKIGEELGVLPPPLERYAGQFDTVPIGVNPHETLLAMKGEFKDFGDLCFRLGFEVLHNRTSTPFLTSDNPVCSYDPRQAFHARTPYEHSGEVELIFPVSAHMLVRGSSKRGPVNMISRHRDISDSHKVRQLNRTIAQFSYRMTIGQDRSSDDLIRAHGAIVPTITTRVRRLGKEVHIICRNVFGPRPRLSQYIDTPEKAARLEARMAATSSHADPILE
ncbi:hypothetical protein MesoLj131a_59480 [Mesorhizobium sp. 131-2-1]|nr:hypothetical protein MesoLj113c_65950 [Mesorhizobium sp. 113-3-9]BCG97084.1 hypothetical protein MesoLj131a_59480 [Mesorhizobium sp. 131-2-1]BCH04155.1 hypothetical protein MesoLj131b_61540 [Mesorhizobium sp. 131-2-5]